MIMVLPTMYRATQNPNEPNLPFAQSLSPTMFRDNQNPNEPNLPFAQKKPRSVFNKKVNTQIVQPPTDYSKHGCSCPNCQKGKGECSIRCAKCNAWDLGCEASCGIDKFITQPVVKWGEDTTKIITDTVEDTTDTIVNWGKDTTKTIIDTVVDTTKTITDPITTAITQPIESLKYLPIVLFGGVALLAMSGRKSRKP